MVRRDGTSTDRDEPKSRDTATPADDPPTRTAETGRDPPVGRIGVGTENRRIERVLWIGFGVLFGAVLLSVYLPVDPIVFVFPFWSVLALTAMLASVIVAGIAGVGYGWPEGYR